MLKGSRMGKLSIILLAVPLCLMSFIVGGHGLSNASLATTPPRGWNSYDSFSWTVSEAAFLDNARIVADRLLKFGYEYVVVDYLWYRRLVPGASQNSPGFDIIDKWGRPIPDPGRWPSSRGGKGFQEIAKRVHDMGLKFGIHVMRGISAQAFNANTLILGPEGSPYVEGGKTWRARDIGLKGQTCSWMPLCFMSVNTRLGAGRAFLRSLYQQYAEWGVDFVKNDCIFGDDLNVNEISTISQIIKELEHPMLYSLSPGTHATPKMAMEINALVNMYRVTADDWDSWNDIQSHFNVARDFAKSGLIGAQGLLGNSWPDLDMLPLGWLTDPGVNQGPHRFTNLNPIEQRTQMTLWAMAKSPLMFGGDLTYTDDATINLVTNALLLDINANSINNKQVLYCNSSQHDTYAKPKVSQSSFNLSSTRGSKVALSVSSCKKKTTNGWVIRPSTKGMNRVCWNGYLERSNRSEVCFHQTIHPTSKVMDSKEIKENNPGQHHILALTIEDLCLDSSSNTMSTFGHVQSKHFSSCTTKESQKWELTHDGNLFNRYAGLCASLTQLEDTTKDNYERIWAAYGLSGEAYIAFFNLRPYSSTISTRKEDWIKIFMKNPIHKKDKLKNLEVLSKKNCVHTDVWSGQQLGAIPNIISIELPSHGSALFVVRCF